MRCISEKRWKVLEYLIIKESEQIEKYLKNKEWGGEQGREPFKTYPAKIAKEIKGVTGVSLAPDPIKTTCEDFRGEQILEVLDTEMGDHLKGRDINPYILRSDLTALRKVVELIFERAFDQSKQTSQFSYLEAMKLLDNYYFTYNINGSLVKDVLDEKNVMISRRFLVIDWDLKSAQRLMELYKNKDEGVPLSDIDKNAAAKRMQSLIKKSEDDKKNDETSIVRSLTEYCTDFLEFVNEDRSTELLNFETRAMRLFESFRFDQWCSSHERPYPIMEPLCWNRLILPIFSDETTKDERIAKIKKENFQQLYYMYHAEGIIEFSLVVETVFAEYSRVLDSLKKIENYLELDDNAILSLHFANKYTEFKTKWKMIVEDNENEYDANLSKRLLEEVGVLNDGLKTELKCLTKKYDAENSDLGSMIERIEYTCDHFIAKNVEKHSTIEDLTIDFIDNNFKTLLNEHESKFEFQKVIIPILALIHTSPMALNEFLNGNWEPSTLEFDTSFAGEELTKSKLLSKLSHITSINLLMYPGTLTKGIVKSASMEHFTIPSYSQSQSEYHSKIDPNEYREMFNLVHDNWYNNLTYAEIKSYEPTFLKLKLKQLYEIQCKLSFSTDPLSSADAPIHTKIDIRNLPELDIYTLKVDNIKNPVTLLQKLKSSERETEYIRKMLSIRMQNKIQFLDTSTQPSLYLVKELVRELNNVLLKPDFYEEGIFQDALHGKDNIKAVLEERFEYKLSNQDIIRMVNKDSLYHAGIIESNNYLLMKLFEEEFDSWFVDIYESHLNTYYKNSQCI